MLAKHAPPPRQGPPPPTLLERLQRDQATNGCLYPRSSNVPLTARELLALAAEVQRARAVHADPVAALLAWNCPRPPLPVKGRYEPTEPRYTDRAGRVVSAQRWANLVAAVPR